jgi:hypothetical protein
MYHKSFSWLPIANFFNGPGFLFSASSLAAPQAVTVPIIDLYQNKKKHFFLLINIVIILAFSQFQKLIRIVSLIKACGWIVY